MDVTIIIIEYRCIDHVERCLDSIKAHMTAMRWECLVVSNSQYNAAQLHDMRTRLAGAHVIASERNSGYAGGVNQALEQATAPYALILNPDCILTDNRVSLLLDTMENSPSIGMIGPRVVDAEGEVQPSCRRFPKPWTFVLVRSLLSKLPLAAAEQRRYLMKDFSRETVMDVDWVSGGAMLCRREVIARIGPMDERYFLYMEDVDWCRRCWEAGFSVKYVPDCTVIHDGQHQSIKGGLRVLASPHLRWHFASLFRYFSKYSWRAAPRSEFYGKSMEQKSGHGS